MDVLVIGSGAREHAIVRALRADPEVDRVLAAPGNPGIAAVATCLPVAASDGPAVARLAREHDVDLVVVGPEAPLVAGVADAVRAAGVACVGPSAAAARLEGSKAFAKEVMASAGVPTATAHVCRDDQQVAAALEAFGPPYVVKDDGLAAGKGVVVTPERVEAVEHARACLAAGSVVVVEEYLDGPEVSLFCLTDGRAVVALEAAQDAKRLRDGDEGPNTGGMGAVSPLPWAPPDLAAEVVRRVAEPVVAEMARRGTEYAGVLYCGLALTSRGLRVVEFNARFGDPETQVVLARLRTPLGQLLHAVATGSLDAVPALRWDPGAAVAVVLAAAGYPGDVVAGGVLDGLAEAAALEGVHVLHAGTAPGPGGGLVAAGGRVLSVVGEGPSVAAARDAAYAGVARLRLEGGQHRTDIAAGAASGEGAEAAAVEAAGAPREGAGVDA